MTVDRSQPAACSFESRRGNEMQSLIERHGGTAVVVASMQEAPLQDNAPVLVLADALEAAKVDVVIFTTGVGALAVQSVLENVGRFRPFVQMLRTSTVIVRGSKPRSVLHNWGVKDVVTVPEPNTSRELVKVLDTRPIPVQNRVVAIQEYGSPADELHEELRRRGAKVLPVPVYSWKLPDDIEPLRQAILRVIRGDFDVLLFTSANQIRNVLTVAGEAGCRDEFLTAARDTVVGSIGPTCSAALVAEGLPPTCEASPPKMAQLVRSALSLARK